MIGRNYRPKPKQPSPWRAAVVKGLDPAETNDGFDKLDFVFEFEPREDGIVIAVATRFFGKREGQ